MAEPLMRIAAKESVMHRLLSSSALFPYHGPNHQTNKDTIKQEFENVSVALMKRPSSSDRGTAWRSFIHLLFKVPDISLPTLQSAVSQQKESVEKRELSLVEAHTTYRRFMAMQLAAGQTFDEWAASCAGAVERVSQETMDFEFHCAVLKVLESVVNGLQLGAELVEKEGKGVCSKV